MTGRVKRAIALFKDFRGNNPDYVDDVEIPEYDTAMVIGQLDGIMYTTVRDGKKESYIHKFKASARPLLASSFDGKQLIIIGGHYNFTDRGIVDKT
jgi:hypothetical protein